MDIAAQTLKNDLETNSAQFHHQPDSAFSLSDDGKILWVITAENGEKRTYPIATLVKSEHFYAPDISVDITEDLNPETLKIVQTQLNTWLLNTIKTKLAFLFNLENAPIKGTGKGIAFQLYEEQGVIFRPRIQNLIKPLELADRQALSRLGVRIGAHYVYVKDCLKPASIRLMSILWRTFNSNTNNTNTPPDGNVSFATPENAPKRFYLTIGYPIFGNLAIRVDMIERLNSTIFEKAVDGKYTFEPSLASTIGASVEQTHKVLHDLGFPAETVTRPKVPVATTVPSAEVKDAEQKTIQEETVPEISSSDTVSDAIPAPETQETETVTETVIIYSLKRIKTHPEKKEFTRKKTEKTSDNNREKAKDARNGENARKKNSSFSKNKQNTRVPDKIVSHGHNAFAGLADLLKTKEK